MATKVWSGGAPTTAQVGKVTPAGTPTENDVFTVTLTDHEGKTHSITFTSTASKSLAETVAGLVAAGVAAKAGGADAWSAVTCADSASAFMTITADTAGNPFTQSSSVSGTATVADATTTANTGPNIFSAAENWVGDIAPVADTDVVIIPATATDAIYGEDMSSSSYLGFTVEDGCPIAIGSPNKLLSIDLKETSYYNATLGGIGICYLSISNYHSIDIINAGVGTPSAGEYATNITGLHDAALVSGRGTIYVRPGADGSVSLAGNANETLEANTINIRSGTVLMGANITDYGGSTAIPINIDGGDTTIRCLSTMLTKTAGTLTREGSTAIVIFNELGGTTYDNSSGLVGTMNIGGGGTVDASNNTVGVTYTNINMWAGAGLKDPHKMITMSTNGVNLNRCGLPGSAGAKVAVLDLGTNLTVTPSTI